MYRWRGVVAGSAKPPKRSREAMRADAASTMKDFKFKEVYRSGSSKPRDTSTGSEAFPMEENKKYEPVNWS